MCSYKQRYSNTPEDGAVLNRVLADTVDVVDWVTEKIYKTL